VPTSPRRPSRRASLHHGRSPTLLLAEEGPLALLAGGTVGLSEKRRLSERGLPDDPALLDDLLALGTAAGLLRPIERTLHLSDAGAAWLRLPGSERWSRLVAGFREALPPVLRSEDGGWIPVDWPGEHPWDPSWPGRTDALVRQARLIGLVADAGRTEPPRRAPGPRRHGAGGSGSLRPRRLRARRGRPDLPAERPDRDRAGPLLPALDCDCAAMAARESARQASSYRFTAESSAGALRRRDGGGVLTFLEGSR
jgi:hypothetical protein